MFLFNYHSALLFCKRREYINAFKLCNNGWRLSENFLNYMAGFFCQIVFIRGKGHSTSYKYSNLIYFGNYRGMKDIWNN